MAPRETPKPTSKVQSRTLTNILRDRLVKAKSSPVSTVKKTMTIKKNPEMAPPKAQNAATTSVVESRQRTRTVPSTPKPKENKTAPKPVPGSVTKSAKKSWKQRPKPAHSGVPLSSKMRKVFEQRLLDDL